MAYTTSTVHGIQVPDSAEANNIPEDIGKVVDVLETGSLIKRLTSTQIAALTSAQKPAGLVVYNTTAQALQVSDGANFGTPMPLGAIIAYGGTTAPAGWAVCDGRAHGSASLQSLIGSANTPDLRERFIVGANATDAGRPSPDKTYSRGNTGGAASVKLNSSQSALPSHSHTVSDPGHAHNFDGAIESYQAGVAGGINFGHITTNPDYGFHIKTATTGISIGSTGKAEADAAHENRPPYYALVYIIKTI